MKTKRSPWTLLAWPASLLAILALIWVTGYVYWQIRISRAIAELKREPSKYFTIPLYKNPDLIDIGSRGFHRVHAALADALDRGDEAHAAALYCGIGDLFEGAGGNVGNDVDESPTALQPRPTLEEIRKASPEFAKVWPEFRDDYPPRWQWWKGHRAGPEKR